MATTAEIQAQLNNVDGSGAQIVKSDQAGGTTSHFYVLGKGQFGGRARWCDTTASDSAATQAASITTAMKNPVTV